MSILSVRDLTVALPPGRDRQHAIESISFTLHPNEILCLVGESGSGKSVSASAVMGLLPPALPVRGGSIEFEGQNLLCASPAEALGNAFNCQWAALGGGIAHGVPAFVARRRPPNQVG